MTGVEKTVRPQLSEVWEHFAPHKRKKVRYASFAKVIWLGTLASR